MSARSQLKWAGYTKRTRRDAVFPQDMSERQNCKTTGWNRVENGSERRPAVETAVKKSEGN